MASLKRMTTRQRIRLWTVKQAPFLAVSSFAPSNIAGLQLWLDGSDITTLFTDSAKTTPVTSDGDVVGAWADKSGNGNDAIQATTANKPLYKIGIKNGLSIGRFDGSDDSMAILDISSGWVGSAGTLMVVYYANNDTAYTVLNHNAPKSEYWRESSGGNAYPATFRNIRLTAYPSMPSLGWLLYGVISGTDYIAYKNGVTQATKTISWQTPTSVTIGTGGGAGPLAGDIAEILIYQSALSVGNRQKVENYLNNKWAVY